MLDHLGAVDVLLRPAFVHGHLHVLLLWVRPDVSRGGVEPREERLSGLAVGVEPFEGLVENLLVEGLHPLAGQRTCIFDLLLADLPELRILRRIVNIGRGCTKNTTWPEHLPVIRVLLTWIVEFLRLLLRVQMIKVAEPVVEPMHRREMLVAITKVVLSELPGRVPL